MVPVSCPPWPGSMTMRPIFRPSARVKECCPSRVGLGSVGGCSAALLGAVDFDFRGVLFEAGGGCFVRLLRGVRLGSRGVILRWRGGGRIRSGLSGSGGYAFRGGNGS